MAAIGKYGLVRCGGLRVCMALRVRHIAVLLRRAPTAVGNRMHLVFVQCDIRLADDASGVLHSLGLIPAGTAMDDARHRGGVTSDWQGWAL